MVTHYSIVGPVTQRAVVKMRDKRGYAEDRDGKEDPMEHKQYDQEA